MKIVDRKTFLTMPEGTIYCKIQFRHPTPEEHAYSKNGWDSTFDIENPSIKGESTENDFYTCGIGDFQAKEGDPMDVLQDICDKAKRCRLKWLEVVTGSLMIRMYTLPSTHAKRCKK